MLFVDKPLFKTSVHEKHKKHEQKQKIKADFVRCVGRAPPFVPDFLRDMLGDAALMPNFYYFGVFRAFRGQTAF